MSNYEYQKYYKILVFCNIFIYKPFKVILLIFLAKKQKLKNLAF